MFLAHPVGELPPVFQVGDVQATENGAAACSGDAVDGLGPGGLVDVGDNDGPALAAEALCRRTPDAAARPGDDCYRHESPPGRAVNRNDAVSMRGLPLR